MQMLQNWMEEEELHCRPEDRPLATPMASSGEEMICQSCPALDQNGRSLYSPMGQSSDVACPWEGMTLGKQPSAAKIRQSPKGLTAEGGRLTALPASEAKTSLMGVWVVNLGVHPAGNGGICYSWSRSTKGPVKGCGAWEGGEE